MKILSIDPANELSAYVLLDTNYNILDKGKIPNSDLLRIIEQNEYDMIAIEIIANMGMIVGSEVFETAEMIGQITYCNSLNGKPLNRLKRADIKRHFKVQTRKRNSNEKFPSADSQIRTTLINRFAKHDFKNGKGTKSDPDYFFGFKADIWSAYAIGCYFLDKNF